MNHVYNKFTMPLDFARVKPPEIGKARCVREPAQPHDDDLSPITRASGKGWVCSSPTMFVNRSSNAFTCSPC